jgi:hypothetical protein
VNELERIGENPIDVVRDLARTAKYKDPHISVTPCHRQRNAYASASCCQSATRTVRLGGHVQPEYPMDKRVHLRLILGGCCST